MEDQALQSAVIQIVADALDVKADEIGACSSLRDDLGAESIDFLDIQYRIESAFRIEIPEGELWQGAIDPADQASIDAGVSRLRERLPGFNWSRLPARITRGDLPRLISIATIVFYLQQRGVTAPGARGTSG